MPAVNYSGSGISGQVSSRSIVNMNSTVNKSPNDNSNMVNHHTKRRHSNRHLAITKEDLVCSKQSVLTAMDRFVKSVNNMSSTVLVPSKLKDMDVATMTGLPAPLTSNNGLYHFYHMFKDVKNELLWGPGTGESAMMIASPSSVTSIGYSGRSSPKEPSSLTSTISSDMNESLSSFHSSRSTGSNNTRSSSPGSSAASSTNNSDDSESSPGDLDSDSTESSVDEETSRLAATFRHHLQGLHAILTQLADSADYLSNRYQEEVEASS